MIMYFALILLVSSLPSPPLTSNLTPIVSPILASKATPSTKIENLSLYDIVKGSTRIKTGIKRKSFEEIHLDGRRKVKVTKAGKLLLGFYKANREAEREGKVDDDLSDESYKLQRMSIEKDVFPLGGEI
jgi:hypothetical protein